MNRTLHALTAAEYQRTRNRRHAIIASIIASPLLVFGIVLGTLSLGGGATSVAPGLAVVQLSNAHETYGCYKVTTTGSTWQPGDAFGGTVCDYQERP